jgi:hypothetical protein
MVLKFGTFVSYVLGKISVKFDGFIRYFKEVRKNVYNFRTALVFHVLWSISKFYHTFLVLTLYHSEKEKKTHIHELFGQPLYI